MRGATSMCTSASTYEPSRRARSSWKPSTPSVQATAHTVKGKRARSDAAAWHVQDTDRVMDPDRSAHAPSLCCILTRTAVISLSTCSSTIASVSSRKAPVEHESASSNRLKRERVTARTQSHVEASAQDHPGHEQTRQRVQSRHVDLGIAATKRTNVPLRQQGHPIDDSAHVPLRR